MQTAERKQTPTTTPTAARPPARTQAAPPTQAAAPTAPTAPTEPGLPQRAEAPPPPHSLSDKDSPSTPPAAPTSQRSLRMPAKRVHFTEEAVKKLACPPGRDRELTWDDTTSGFGVRVSAGGRRMYVVSCRQKGSQEQKTLNVCACEETSLKDAREKALEMRRAIQAGTVVKAAKAAEGVETAATADTIKDDAFTITLWEVWLLMEHESLGEKKGERREATKERYRYTLSYYLKSIKDKPVASINKETCRALFHQIGKGVRSYKRDGAKTPTASAKVAANNAMTDLHAVLEYARNRYMDDEDRPRILIANPVKQMRKTTKPNFVGAKTRHIEDHAVRKVYRLFKQQGLTGPSKLARTSADWIRFVFLTGLRRTQSNSLRWSHVDFKKRKITMAGLFAKNGREWVCPISEPMRALLLHRRALFLAEHEGRTPPSDDWVFPSSRSACGHITGCRRLLEKVFRLFGQNISPHDLRRTVNHALIACGVDFGLRQLMLDHLQGVHLAHYENDRMVLRDALEKLGAYLEGEDTQDHHDEEDGQDAIAQDLCTAAPAAEMPDEQKRRHAWNMLTRAQLGTLVWEMSGEQVGRIYGVTGKAVEKRCKRLGLTKPGLGYWAKVTAGRIDKVAPPTFE
jgi:integrase